MDVSTTVEPATPKTSRAIASSADDTVGHIKGADLIQNDTMQSEAGEEEEEVEEGGGKEEGSEGEEEEEMNTKNPWEIIRCDLKKVNGMRRCQYQFFKISSGEKRMVMYNHVVAKGPEFVKAVEEYWMAKENAGKITALQKEARDRGHA